METKQRKDIGNKLLLGKHRSLDCLHLRSRPPHTVKSHSVVALLLRLSILHSKHIVNYGLWLLILKHFFKKIVRLPYKLVGTSPYIGLDAIFLPQYLWRKAFIDFAVPHKEQVVVFLYVIILTDKRSFRIVFHILRHKQSLNENKNGKGDANGRNYIYFPLHSSS